MTHHDQLDLLSYRPRYRRFLPRYENLTGREFTRLTARRFVGVDGRRDAIWECECSCDGRLVHVLARNLKAETTRSCGCLREELRESGTWAGHWRKGSAA